MTEGDSVGSSAEAPDRVHKMAQELTVDGLEPLLHEIDRVRRLARDEHMTDEMRGRLLRRMYDVARTTARERREQESE